VKNRGVERRVRMGLETRDRVGWWQRGMRAMQFKATSSGRDGIRFGASASTSCSEGEGLHMTSVVVECYFPAQPTPLLFLFLFCFIFSNDILLYTHLEVILFYFKDNIFLYISYYQS